MEGGVYSIGTELVAAFIQLYNLTSAFNTGVLVCSFEACGITSDDPDHIHCTKEGGIAEAAREALKDLDESLLNVNTNCEDADEDNDCRKLTFSDSTFLYRTYNIASHIPIVVHS